MKTKKVEQRIYSDLRKVDAHEPTPEEYEEAPELTDEQIREAVRHSGGKPVKRRRPRRRI